MHSDPTTGRATAAPPARRATRHDAEARPAPAVVLPPLLAGLVARLGPFVP